MTTQEIYTLSNGTTESQFNSLFNLFSSSELKQFETLVRLGDRKEVSLWTIISERHNKTEISELYNIAYKS